MAACSEVSFTAEMIFHAYPFLAQRKYRPLLKIFASLPFCGESAATYYSAPTAGNNLLKIFFVCF
jgi:hypothetical protein